VLINRPAHNSGLAKAARKFVAKIKHPLGSLRQAPNRYMIAYEATAKETRFKSFLTSNQKSILL